MTSVITSLIYQKYRSLFLVLCFFSGEHIWAAPELIAWGANGYGQTNVPVGLTGIKSFDAGGQHTIVLKNDGSVIAWGNNWAGQTNVPIGLTGVKSVVAGGHHCVVLKNDGSLSAWGYGDGSAQYSQTAIPGGLGVVAAIDAGNERTLAMRADGTVAAWGNPSWNQTQVPTGLNGVKKITAGGEGFNIALKTNDTLVVWGYNGHGQASVPSGLNDINYVVAGEFHIVALKNDGTLVAWGLNDHGQCNIPNGLRDVVAVSAGRYHTVALKRDGTVVAWGLNDSGQTDVPVGLQKVAAISAGGDFTVVQLRVPIITSQPQSLTMVPNAFASFSVAATGTGTLSYQWQKDGIDIPGATSASFSLASAQPWHIGDYKVKVTDSVGAVTSDVASLGLVGLNSGIWKGLVSYHPFNNSFNDKGFHGLHFISNGAEFSSDRNGNVNDALLAKNTAGTAAESNKVVPINGSSPRTISFWLKLPQGAVSGGIGAGWGNAGANGGEGFSIAVGSSGTSLWGHFADADVKYEVALDVWHHLVCVYSESVSSTLFYLNGQQIGPISLGPWNIRNDLNTTQTGLKIAGYAFDQTQQNASIDDIRVYARALTISEIQQLYASELNQQPSLTAPSNQTILENTATNVLNVTVADQESSASSLVVTASSSDTTLVPNANIVLGGSGANRTVRVTPAVGLSGSATITLTVSDGVSSASRSFQLNVTPIKPLFTLNPEAETAVNPNNSITFTASYVAGIAPFTYRWRKNGTFIGGANANSYTVASAKQSDEASYDCVITNNFGSFTTSATVLTVNDPVVIVTPPLAQAANAGQQVTLTVNVTGTEPIAYQWRKNGVPLSDQNAPQLVLEVDANSTGFYDVLVTNPVSSVSTLPALLTALVPPVITSQPSSQDLSVGSTAFFTVTATGPNLTYQWRRNGSNLGSQTGPMLMLSNVQKANEGVYDVLVKNSFGAVLSDPVWLTLPQLLSLTEQPQDVTVAPGDTASFSVTASGPGLLTYQWNKDGKPIKDAKFSTLSVPVNDAVTAAGAYTVTVSSGSLKVTSIPAYLRVSEAGLLIYKFTVTGNYFAGTRSSLIAQSGLLILDRLNQRGGIIRYGKNGKLDTFSTEIKDGLRTHSTGPMTNSQTVVSQVLQAGGAPNEEVAVLWLRGTDGAVTFSVNDKTLAPKTLAGFQTELILTEGTEVESLSVNATLDNATSLQARQAGETVEQTLNRLSAGLQQKGFIRE